MEVWKQIIEAPNYSVSNMARIKNNKTGRILSPSMHRKGYLQITLRVDKRPKTFLIHRLVAIAFVPNPNNLPEVNHKDGNKTNCNQKNLEWCTNGYNQEHKYRILGHESATYKPVVCVETGVVYKGICVAARAVGVGAQQLSDCLRGRYHTAGGLHWKYASEVS